MGKPRGNAPDPFFHAKGSVTLLLQLGRKGHVHAPTRDEDCLPWRDSHSEEPRFRLAARNEESYPALSGKFFRRSRGISRARALNRKGERYSRVVPPFQESPRCLSPFQRNLFSLHCLDFHAEDPLTPWWHVGQPCGKPRGKASRESHRSLDPRDGKRDTTASLSLRSRS